MTSRARQCGFSLVEMMVALVIGLFVLAGVGSVYITGKRSYNARDGLSLLQENGRIAIRMIEQTVLRAGYPMYAEVEPVIHSAQQIRSMQLGENASVEEVAKLDLGLSSDGTEKGASDTLTVAYQPVPGSSWEAGEDCVGNRTQLKELVVSRFFVEDGVLKCQGSGKRTAEPLADNVVAMQVEYGADQSGDGFVDRYAALPDVLDWQKVVSIRVALLVSSGEDVLDQGAGEKQRFLLAGEEFVIDDTSDRKLYRVFTTTIPLRNRMPIF